jgi:hypothetical protein
MSETLKSTVIAAVFQRQLNTGPAIKYIVHETGVSAAVAAAAIKQVLTRQV